jgi:uncharacterized membrane protein YfcA
MIEFFTLIIIGSMVGLVSSFFGIGGGIIMIPALYSMYDQLPPTTIIGCSLGVIFLSTTLNSYNFKKSGFVISMNLFLLLSLNMAIGVLLGAEIAFYLPSNTIKTIFGVALIFVALKTIIFKSPKSGEDRPLDITGSVILKISFIGLFGGLAAGITGLGGGAVMVPLFLLFLKVPFHWVPAYSNLAMMSGGLIGLIRFSSFSPPESIPYLSLAPFQVGQVNWAIILSIFLGSIVTSKIGIMLGRNVPPRWSKGLFTGLLIFLAIKILIFS